MTRAVRYWIKLITMDRSRLPVQCYNVMLSLDENGRSNWVSHIKDILFRLGFGFVWVAQDVGHINTFIPVFKQRLFDNLHQKWVSELETSSKARYYKQFKSLLNVELYLTSDFPIHLIKAMAKFRCSNYGLAVETGRYDSTDYLQRLCPFCLKDGLSYIEDEFHLLLVCKQYETERNKYISKHVSIVSPQSFINTMSSPNCNVIHDVSQFLAAVYKSRLAFVHKTLF